MNLLLIDHHGTGLHLAMLAEKAGHSVKLWIPPSHTGLPNQVGAGIVERLYSRDGWKKWMKWADLIIPTDNAHYIQDLKPFFQDGFPIFGANEQGTRLELDRTFGQDVFSAHGLAVNKYEVFHDYDEAIEFVKKTNKAYASKPLGDSDKALSYVAHSPAALVFKLERWKRKKKLQKGFILQELVEGQEVAIGGWFGPGGWCSAVCENWEEKRLMNGGLGDNTGEQGTVVRYVRESKLFTDVLAPFTEYLHSIEYVGYVDVNCIVNSSGQPVPLEWTCRFGDPTLNIQSFLHEGDPIEWMRDLLRGQDTLRVKKDIAVGVVLSHGDYPYKFLTEEEVSGYPLDGLTQDRKRRVAFAYVKRDRAPVQIGRMVEEVETFVTAGNYVLIGVGVGKTVNRARQEAYETMWALNIPSNRMFRTDIGERLEKDLRNLQRHGFCSDMRYSSSSSS